MADSTINPPIGTAAALAGLRQALDTAVSATEAGGWRWTVRRHMGPVRDAIEREHLDGADGWLSARHGRSARERAALLGRLAAYGPLVLEHPDPAEVRDGLKRLLGDIEHYVQRQHDLAYDEVELEIGGSE
jgi:hypothetical protein